MPYRGRRFGAAALRFAAGRAAIFDLAAVVFAAGFTFAGAFFFGWALARTGLVISSMVEISMPSISGIIGPHTAPTMGLL